MIPRKHRMTHTEVEEFKKGPKKTYTGDSMKIEVRYEEAGNQPKFSCVVSNKVTASAVQRNKLRRRCYSYIKKHLTDIQPSTVMIRLYKKAAELSHQEFISEIDALFKKAHVVTS